MNKVMLPVAAAGLFAFSLAFGLLEQESVADAAQPHPPAMAARTHQHHHQHEHEHGADFVSPGKPAAAIVLASAGVQIVDLHSRTNLNVLLQNRAEEGTVYVQLQAQGGLQLLSEQSQWEYELQGSSTLSLPIEVMAQTRGTHLLHLFIQHRGIDGVITPRALAIQINAGLATDTIMYAKQSQDLAQHPQVIPLQAVEEIY